MLNKLPYLGGRQLVAGEDVKDAALQAHQVGNQHVAVLQHVGVGNPRQAVEGHGEEWQEVQLLRGGWHTAEAATDPVRCTKLALEQLPHGGTGLMKTRSA